MLYNSSCGTFSTWVYQDALYQEIGKLSLGIQRIDFDAEVEAGDGTSFMTKAEGLPTGLLWQGPMSFNLDVVATLDEAVRPLKGEEIDAGVRESLGVAFSNWGANDERTALLVLDPDGRFEPQPRRSRVVPQDRGPEPWRAGGVIAPVRQRLRSIGA
jgi:hypothetical protein